MKIAQVAPLIESVPPARYGGTERIVAYLVEELVKLGHEVTLFASGDSRTRAKQVATLPQCLRASAPGDDELAYHYVMLEKVFQLAPQFDLIHFHTDYIHFPQARLQSVPHITTLHGRLDLRALKSLYTEFSDIPVVSISQSQRQPIPQANWQATVLHGIALEPYEDAPAPSDKPYLAFLGRISPEKGLDQAVEIARRAGTRLKVAAKVDRADENYYQNAIKPLFARSPHVEFIGEIGEAEKPAFLGQAQALLFPVNWPEPFGLVLIEAMACGTPVIAFACGSVPEVVDEGITGFIVSNVDEAVEKLGLVPQLSRDQIRAVAKRRFAARRMAEDYLRLYGSLLDRDRPRKLPPVSRAYA